MIRTEWNSMRQTIGYRVTLAERSVSYATRAEAEQSEIEGAKKYKAFDSPLSKMMIKLLEK